MILGCLDNPGVPAAAVGGGHWRIADVDSDKFGEVVLDSDIGNPDENALLEVGAKRRRSHSLDGVIYVLDYVEDYAVWAETKRPGLPGGHAGDLRLLGSERNSLGKRAISLKRALELMTAHTYPTRALALFGSSLNPLS